MEIQDFLELLAPRRCAQCRDPIRRAVLCSGCQKNLPWLPIGDRWFPAPQPLKRCLGLVSLSGTARTWIHRFKYPSQGAAHFDADAVAVAKWLARIAALECSPLTPSDRIVPVPLHGKRLRRRGFNPAWLLAREMARQHSRGVEARCLIRSRATHSQTKLGALERVENVKNAFRCRHRKRLAGRRVFLVDDVYTTGATLAAASRALHQAGVEEVVGVCIARTQFAMHVHAD